MKQDTSFEDNMYLILKNKENPEKLRFFAYYVIYTYYRRHKDYSIARKFMEEYLPVFEDEPMFQVTRNMILELSNDKDEIEQGIRISHELTYSKAFENNVGIYQTYAESVINGIEKEINLIIQDENKYLNRALELMQKAINQKKYAKYYFTYGRLLYYSAKNSNDIDLYKKAKKSILRAIDLEDSNKDDYSLQITEYQSYLTRIEILMDYKRLHNQHNQKNQKTLKKQKENSSENLKTIAIRVENTPILLELNVTTEEYLVLEYGASQTGIPLENFLISRIRAEIREIMQKHKL